MILRVLAPGDGPAWRALMTEAVRAHPAAFLLSGAEVAALSAEQVAASLERGHLHGLFAEDRLVGFAGLHLRQRARLRHRADIGPFYVVDLARGTGAADRLMDGLAARARAGGVAWLDLWVAASNGRARAFYARHAFREVARREDAVRMGDRSEDDVLMTRRLVAPPG